MNPPTTHFDLLIDGAHVIDVATGVDRIADIGVRAGRIAAVGDLGAADAPERVDGAGLYASAGWIDLHVHCFVGHHELALDIDAHGGVHHGVTTVVDTGSFTSSEIDAFRTIAARARTRVLGFVNVSAHPGRPVHGDWQQFDQRLTIETVRRHRDLVVGVKVLASQNHVGNLGRIPLDLAVQAARESETRLMAHIGMAPPVIQQVLDALEAGDIVTHCFKGYPRGIMNRHGRPVPEAWSALERGVWFDTGHGQDSYTFAAHRQAIAAGFPVHSLSTDLHLGNVAGPVYSLAHTMTKGLHLGASLLEVVGHVTLAPATMLGREAEFGTLAPGSCADVTLFRVVDEPITVTDSEGNAEVAERHVEVALTLRAGAMIPRAAAVSPPSVPGAPGSSGPGGGALPR